MDNILVTGSAGFIGSALSLRLLEEGFKVIGIDNHNDYYDPLLKEERLSRHLNHDNYHHYRIDIKDVEELQKVFEKYKFKFVINLAAQAGVRYSIENPTAYINTNILGFYNILELSKNFQTEHFIYASSSSVYGANKKIPFSTSHNTDHPQSLYGATKKTNEIIAHSYSHIYKIPTTGLRFFTVYGPWGRPDMSLFKFTKSIIENKTIKVFNNGNHMRDFTYIDDIIDGIMLILKFPPTSNNHWDAENLNPKNSNAPWRLYNIGNSNPVNLIDYINAIEASLGLKAKKEFVPQQLGDVLDTYADIKDLEKDF